MDEEGPCPQCAEYEGEIETLKDQVSALETELGDAKTALEGAMKTFDEIVNDLNRTVGDAQGGSLAAAKAS